MNLILAGRSSGGHRGVAPVLVMLFAGMSLVACTGDDPNAAPSTTSEDQVSEPAVTTALAATATSTASAGVDSSESGPLTSPDAGQTLGNVLAQAKEWPLRQQLAQLMFVGVNADGTDGKPGTDPAVVQALIDAGVGGVFVGRKEVEVFASDVMLDAQDNAVPPLVATDGEGGIVDLAPEIVDPLPPAREMARWDDARIQEVGAGRGKELLDRGVNVDFAPVVDVAGGANPLDSRTWSDDPDVVATKSGAFAEGLCESGVYPTLKHFPGHGRADAHGDDAPARTPPLSDLETNDILPFRQLIEQMDGRSLLMTGHLDVPGLTSDGAPFSLDPEAMKYLRDDMGYDGVTVTDELAEMGAITQRGISGPDAVEESLIAGNDMALYFADVNQLDQVLDQLEQAVVDRRLSQVSVDDSLARVLTLKASKNCPA